MTRSVEIPEAAEVAATEAALAAGFVDPDDGTIPQWLNDGNPAPVWTHPSEAVKVILAAALPYLAPAAKCTCDGPGPEGQHRHWCDLMYGPEPEEAAPAGDGGLREALGEAWDDGNATGLDGYVGPGRGAGEVDPEAERARARVLDKLAAHPAAPAVPQPVDREALWDAIAKVRDSYPRLSNDAPTDEIIDAVLAVLAGEQEQARPE